MSQGPAQGRAQERVSPVPEPPVLPERAAEDHDSGWGERPEDDDERLTRERPPHW